MLPSILLPLISIVLLTAKVHASCECGFRDEQGRIWQDALVIPFKSVPDLATSPDLWMNDYEHERGFGNSTYVMDPKNSFKDGDDLVLKVTAPEPDATRIISAQVSSRRKDIMYGTFRAVVKMPFQKGSTCFGFFSYTNDTEEIDIEFIGQKPDMLYLSSKSTNPINYTADIDYKNYYYAQGLDQYHEYRFDWLPNQVDFFVDNKLLYNATFGIPTQPARWMVMNWANQDKQWSGTPLEDSYARVTSVVAFFNSSHPQIVAKASEACEQFPSTVCDIETIDKTKLYGYKENAIRQFMDRRRVSSNAFSLYPFALSSRIVLIQVLMIIGLTCTTKII